MTRFEKCLVSENTSKAACPVFAVSPQDLVAVTKNLSKTGQAWVKSNGFAAASGETLAIANENGALEAVLFGLGKAAPDPFLAGRLPGVLPEGLFELAGGFDDVATASLAFLLGTYQFAKYRTTSQKKIILKCSQAVDRKEVLRIANAVARTRDLINTPANDMGPQELQDAANELAGRYKAKIRIIKGAPLQKGFPLVHAVGRASSRAPRLIDFTWGTKSRPKVTLVGKGVVFDTGGLDIKPSNSMILMKKDMGGAANVLGLAQMIMDAKIKVRLRVLIPAVENAVGGDAFRPSDVLKSRKGITVEVGNTDAEGRLVLADALALADEEEPELLIDMATLTGAARVALGPDLSPFYVDDDILADQISQCGQMTHDPLWRMPFWRGYEKNLSSKLADTNSISSGGFGGSITAALFLNKFVDGAQHHIHFDIYGWTPSAKPARPVGGEAQGIRALYEFLKDRYQ
jgi:leucyl aminopeptidase